MCQSEKEESEFGKNAGREDGLQSYCRLCTKTYNDNRCKKKPEGWVRKTADLSAYSKKYRNENRDILRKKRNAWLAANPEYEKEKKRRKHERKMKLIHGPDYIVGAPENKYFNGSKLTEEEMAHHAKAKQQVRSALRNGTLTKLPCFICGNEKVEGHHPDYDAPLDVVWLCRSHHMQLHREFDEYSPVLPAVNDI
jgi:hypothetical protein